MADFQIKNINSNHTHFDIDISFKKIDSFAQKLLLILNTWKNEFAYDTTAGIDYYAVLSKDFSMKSLEAFFLFSLKDQIKEFDTFDEYVLVYNYETQTANISFTAYSISGESKRIDNFEI